MSALEYHIHVDGQAPIPEPHRSWFLSQGFWADQFVPIGKDADFAPHDHVSFETTDRAAYRNLLLKTLAYLEANPYAVVGYVEAEAITSKVSFEAKVFDPDVPLPIRLLIQPVAEFQTNVPPNWFRQGEMHFSCQVEGTDPRLVDALREIGLYTAHYVSSVDNALYVIFTVQGYQKDLARLLPMLVDYLNRAGGHANGQLGYEVVTKSWKSSPDVPLPPIINPASFRG